jgi:hypothetical protein
MTGPALNSIERRLRRVWDAEYETSGLSGGPQEQPSAVQIPLHEIKQALRKLRLDMLVKDFPRSSLNDDLVDIPRRNRYWYRRSGRRDSVRCLRNAESYGIDARLLQCEFNEASVCRSLNGFFPVSVGILKNSHPIATHEIDRGSVVALDFKPIEEA